MAMKIQLNTAALERLLSDDDGAIKLELTQSVVEEFSRRHLKAVANSATMVALKSDIIRACEQIVTDEIGEMESGFRSDRKFIMKPSARTAIAKTVREEFRAMVREEAETLVKEQMNGIERTVQSLTASKIRAEVDRQVSEKIKKALGNLS